MSAETSWRLRHQAAELTRLFIDAGVSGNDALDAVARLGRQLDVHRALLDDATQLSGEVVRRGRASFDELTRLNDHADATTALIRSVHERLGDIARVERSAADASIELLGALQELPELRLT